VRLTKKHKEIIASALALHVEEMPDGETKELTIQILETFQHQGIWGNCDGFFADEYED
jgi:hypothetical protein